MDEPKNDEQLNNPSASSEQDDSTSSPRAPSVDLGQAELEKTKQERDEYLNGWKRAKADLMNYQRDEAKRFEDMANYSREMVISDLITVLDSMELAARMHSPVRGNEGSQLSDSNGDGLQRIKIQLEDALKRYGLEKIKVSPGDAFDPNLHESLGEQEDQELKSGSVAVEISSGYKIRNKVIRPTRVKLVK